LWDEVKDRLSDSGTALSGGQQQRLCIAPRHRRRAGGHPDGRTLFRARSHRHRAHRGADPRAAWALRHRHRHAQSMQQAARVSQRTAFFHLGTLVEYGVTSEIFTNPRELRTKDYITGRYG
jgi:phosphate transport system ATP-binding protein